MPAAISSDAALLSMDEVMMATPRTSLSISLRRTRKMISVVFSVGILFLVLLQPASARGQATGTILGSVTDPSGSVLPNARVTAVRVETSVAQATVTGTGGTYTISNLAVGTYRVTVEAAGFKAGSVTDIKLDVSQQRQVDFKLSLVGVEFRVQ